MWRCAVLSGLIKVMELMEPNQVKRIDQLTSSRVRIMVRIQELIIIVDDRTTNGRTLDIR